MYTQLFTNSIDDHLYDYALWDKIAEGVGNLQALCKISIVYYYFVDCLEEAYWDALACIL